MNVAVAFKQMGSSPGLLEEVVALNLAGPWPAWKGAAMPNVFPKEIRDDAVCVARNCESYANGTAVSAS